MFGPPCASCPGSKLSSLYSLTIWIYACWSIFHLWKPLFSLRKDNFFLFLSFSSSCLQGTRVAGRDSRRSNWTDTRKLCGVFIVLWWKKSQSGHLLGKQSVESGDLTAQKLNVYWTLFWVDCELKLDRAEPYQMDLIQEWSGADWRENHKLHWKKTSWS